MAFPTNLCEERLLPFFLQLLPRRRPVPHYSLYLLPYSFSPSLARSFSFQSAKLDYCFRQYTEPPQSWTSSSPVLHTYLTPDKSMLPMSASALLTRNTVYSTPGLVPSSCTTTAPLAALFASFQPPTNIRKRRNLDTPLLGFTFSTLLLRW